MRAARSPKCLTYEEAALPTPSSETLPGPALLAAKGVWNRLSPKQRQQLERWLPGAGSISGVKDIFKFITDNYRSALDHTPSSIAIVGPTNVGKSTLYNQLIAPAEVKAVVSPVPGTTRVNQAGSAGLFSVVDTPGVDLPGSAGEAEREIALNAARSADFLVIMFAAECGVKKPDRELFETLTSMDKPHLVVLNKMDLVRRAERENVLNCAAEALGIERTEIVDIAAAKGDNVGTVVLAVAQADPRLLIALADALPAYRARLAWQRTIGSAVAAASVALIPLPMADVVPLLGVQTGMVLTIARIYGYDITPARAKELIATFGVGFAARTLYRELSKAFGVPGWILSSVVAASGTLAMGSASMLWFERGEKPSQEAMRRLMGEIGGYLREQLTGGGKEKLSPKEARRRLQSALEGLPERFGPQAK
jgi:small GTP-binding protein